MYKQSLSNSLIISTMRMLMGGGKIQPLRVSAPLIPSFVHRTSSLRTSLHSFILLVLCVCLYACSSKPQSEEQSVPQALQVVGEEPVRIPASIFFNRDSVMYYAELGYEHDDPYGLFVIGACYYLRTQGELPDYISTVSHEEADKALMASAMFGCPEAIDLIQCLKANGGWKH